MSSHYKNKDLLKIHPFYSTEIKTAKKKSKKLVISMFFLKNQKNDLILNYREYFHFHQKNLKDLKD